MSADKAAIQRMTDAVRHRGPDDCGFYADDHVTLGHRRLGIIDLSGGHQPMANEDGSVQIVYNGEVFNHTRLRTNLERAGHRYRTHCDTETIVHAYEEYGDECISRFRGMFAFALWDKNAKRLFCARDRLGKKPLYYWWNGTVLVFASEIKAILKHPAVTAECEATALPEYLAFGYLSGEATLFRGIKSLLPGHSLSLDLKSGQPCFEIREYWDIPAFAQSGASESEVLAETRRRLEDAVETRLMSDVPLGMFLSGGVDSSAIAAITKRLTQSTVKTFSVGYHEEQYSELNFAAQVARTIGTEHHEVRIGRDEFFDALPHLIWHEDKPTTWPSSVSLFFVSKLASEHVKVVLSGEGADELFAGYERYRWNLLNSRAASIYAGVPDFFRRTVRNFITNSKLLKADLRRTIGHTFLARDSSVESLYLENFYTAFDRGDLTAVFREQAADPYTQYLRYFGKRAGKSLLSRMLYADQKTYLVELLMKQDRMSMAASIESRVPLLDHEFVEFAASIPDSLRIRGNIQKYIFKRAVEDLLPRDIVYRKKMGFPTPIRSWLRDERAQPLFDDLLDSSGFLASALDKSAIEKLVSHHVAGEHDATDQIWRLLNLKIWGDLFITGSRRPIANALKLRNLPPVASTS